MQETKQKEKRGSVRVELKAPVKYRFFKNDSIFQENFSVGRSQDISVSGLKWAVGSHNPVGAKLDMELEFSDVLSAYVVAKVVGTEDQVINGIIHRFDRVTFLEMDKETQDLLMRQVFEILRKKRR